MYPVYQVPSGDVLPIFFDTFDGGTGASVTMTGLAATDIEIYKDGGATQRASDAGYTLLDTDGIDFDGITGIHGFSIDTGDNTDAGFYTVGAWFHVIVSAITVDGQTVSFCAAAFRIMAAEGVAGVPDVNVTHVSDTAQTARDLGGTLGVAGAGLTAVPWNASWDAEVQSEVQDAIEVNHLDHLLAVTYDPASKPGVADALLNELVESDAGVARFTANSLEQAPGGGGAVLEIASGTVGNASASAPDLGTLTFGDGELVDYLIRIFDSSASEYHARWIDANVGSTSVVTLDEVLPFTTESGVDTWTVYAIQRDSRGVLRTGTAAAGAGDSITLDSGASATDDFYNGAIVLILRGTGAGQAPRAGYDYVGSTKVLSVDPNWVTTPDSTSFFMLIASPPAAAGAGAPTVALINDAITAAKIAADAGTELGSAVWASAARTLTAATNITSTGGTTVPQTGDSFARLGAPTAASVSADILAIDNLVDDLESRIGTPSDLGGGATVGANLVAIEGQTDDIGAAGAGLTAVPWNAAWDAEVQSEVQDAIDAARAEPGQGTPAANASLGVKIDYLFKNWRNRKTQTATDWFLFGDDAVTVDQKATVADNGTTASKTEIATGP